MGKFRPLSDKALRRLIYILCIFFITGCTSGHNKADSDTGSGEVPYGLTTFSFDQKENPYQFWPAYQINAGDILDVLFQIKTWEKKPEYRLGIDDLITIKFLHAPELNTDEKVHPDGNIALPYIGKFQALGKTIEEIQIELSGHYKGIFQNPEVQVLVPEFRASIKELKADLKTAPRGLSRLVTVRPDGYVTFPLVGNTFVGGRTFPDVNKELNERYDKIIPGLYVDLFLEHHAGSRMYILGQVYKPGVYDIPKPLTIEQAIAMAGGYMREARLNDIFVVRKQYDRMIATRIDFANKFNNNNREYKFFYLKPDDILYVPKRPINKAAELMRDVSEILLFRGWSFGFSWELHDEPADQP